MPDLERGVFNAYAKALSLTRQMPAERNHHEHWPMTVSAVVDLAPRLRRITFTSPRFEHFEPLGPDEYFGLLMPQPGRPLFLPESGRLNIRAAIHAMPQAQRPDLRWYTIRKLDRENASIDVDIVTHGDTGPGSAWALRAQPGIQAGFRTATACYSPGQAERQLLVADETALPALAAIAQARPAGSLRAFVETAGPEVSTSIDAEFEITWLDRGEAPGEAMVAALRDEPSLAVDYAWVCGESGMATAVRRHLVRERKLARTSVMFSGYWKLGQARG